MEFVAKSPAAQKILNTLRVSANLPVNILIWGEDGVGKRSLVRSVFKELEPIEPDEIPQTRSKDLYIPNLHRCANVDALMERLGGRRLIATANELKPAYEEHFPVILHLPPLRERPEDLEALKRRYIQEAERDFGITIDGDLKADLSQNAISLKRSILTHAVLASLGEEELMELMERQLAKRLEEGYKKLLYLFEVPLLRAAKKRYRSNLAISKALQLNRATVTSKMNRYKGLIE